jgi:hypothetical protein
LWARASAKGETSEEQGAVISDLQEELGVHIKPVIEVIKNIARPRLLWEALFNRQLKLRGVRHNGNLPDPHRARDLHPVSDVVFSL